mgnify:CR=1 FL=1
MLNLNNKMNWHDMKAGSRFRMSCCSSELAEPGSMNVYDKFFTWGADKPKLCK